jgi:drug/metabolite transporter (DMT)-like permease
MVAYATALVAFLPFAARAFSGVERHRGDLVVLILAAGWTNTAFVLAVLEGEVVRVVLLFYLSPLWTALLGRWLLGEALTARTAVMLLLGLSGAAIMLWGPAMGRTPLSHSDLLAVSAGFAFAVNNVMTRRIDGLGIRAKVQAACLGVVLVSGAVVVLAGVPLPQVDATTWGAAALLGLCGFLLSTVAVTYGVSRMPVQRSAVIMLFELIVGALSAWWLAGERVTASEWLGGSLILAAGLVAVLYRGAKQ